MELETQDFQDASSFVAALYLGNLQWGSTRGRWVFRGQRDETWTLTPAILRADRWKTWREEATRSLRFADWIPAPLAINFVEIMLLARFVEIADDTGQGIPGADRSLFSGQAFHDMLQDVSSTWGSFPSEPLLGPLTFAQHYGVPTRLLDWSWDPLVAAYFAACQAAFKPELGSSICVWALSAEALLSQRKRAGRRVELVAMPQNDNARLQAQAGLFTLDRRADSDRCLSEVLVDDFESDDYPVLRKLVLPHSEALAVLQRLSLMGVGPARVYTGLESVAQEVHQRIALRQVESRLLRYPDFARLYDAWSKNPDNPPLLNDCPVRSRSKKFTAKRPAKRKPAKKKAAKKRTAKSQSVKKRMP